MHSAQFCLAVGAIFGLLSGVYADPDGRPGIFPAPATAHAAAAHAGCVVCR